MTKNQIEFGKLQEQKRTNLENERILEEHNRLTRAETERRNRADEAIREMMNVINAQHYSRSDAEARRSNLSKEQLNYLSYYENQMHNRETEDILRQQNAINQQNADTATGRASYQNLTDVANAGRANAQAGQANAQAGYYQAQTDYLGNKDRREQAQLGLETIDTGAKVIKTVVDTALQFIPLLGD